MPVDMTTIAGEKTKPRKFSRACILIQAVSYTHLDVYKRQHLYICIFKLSEFIRKVQ